MSAGNLFGQATSTGGGEGDGEEAFEHGFFVHDGMAVRYRIIHRVPGEYTVQKTLTEGATVGWYWMNAEYKYGAQIEPVILKSWLTGLVGSMRTIMSCTIPANKLKTLKRDEYELLALPRVGDRITVKKRIRYKFVIDFRIGESGSVDIGFFNIPVYSLTYTYSYSRQSRWITKETQVWEVIEIVDPDNPVMPDAPAP